MPSQLSDSMAMVLRIAGIPFDREYRFHPTRKWRFDIALQAGLMDGPKVAIECDGGVWSGGRHVRGKGYLGDMEKLNEAAVLGWRVLRVSREHIEDGRALDWVERIIR